MFCPVCNAMLYDGAQVCMGCGTPVGSMNQSPFGGQQQPGGQSPYGSQQPFSGGQSTYGGGQSPYGGGQPPYGGGQPPYGGGQPPYGGGQPPFGGGQPPFGGGQPPYGGGQPPYGGGQPPFGGGQPPYGAPPPQKSNLMKIIIPIGAVVVIGLIVLVLWLTGVFSSGGGNAPPEPSSTRSSARDRDNDRDDDDDDDPRVSGAPSPRPPTPSSDDDDNDTTPTPTESGTSATPTESGSPSTSTPTGPPMTGSIPGGGGDLRGAAGDVSFTPDRSGFWTMRTRKNDGCDPMLTVYGPGGAFIASNDDGAPYFNSFLIAQLDAGATYTINVSFYGDAGDCTLTVVPADTIPPGGGDIHAVGFTGYTFTPNQSGMWTIATSNEVNCNPYIAFFDQNGELVIFNDNYVDTDPNARVDVNLTSGVTYTINCGDYHDDPVDCTLTVTQGGSSPSPSPTPTSSSTPGGGQTLPGDGASMQVNVPGSYSFTPSNVGLWSIHTENASSELQIMMYNPSGNLIADNSGNWDGRNGSLIAVLYSQNVHTIEVRYTNGSSGTCNIVGTVPRDITGSGGSFPVTNITGFTIFTESAGEWELRATNCSRDTGIIIFDASLDVIERAFGDNSNNPVARVYLNGNDYYFVMVQFQGEVLGTCTLEVSRR